MITLILSVILVLCVFSCEKEESKKITTPENAKPYAFVPVEHTIYSEEGKELFKRTVSFDKDGYISEINEISSGFHGENEQSIISIKNTYDEESKTLLQNYSYGDEEGFKMKWHFKDERTISGITTYSQGEHYEEAPENYGVDLFRWLNSDGSSFKLDNAEYPVPTMEFANTDIFDKIFLVYSEDDIANNPYIKRVMDSLNEQYPDIMADPNVYYDLSEYVAYDTLWAATAKKQADGTYVTEIKYGNGTVGERIVWKNVDDKTFLAFQLVDWDWFWQGTLDFTVFRAGNKPNPPYVVYDVEN